MRACATLADTTHITDDSVKLPKFLSMWQRKPRRRSTDHINAFTTQIGIGLHFRGVLQGKGNYLIQGEVVGDGNIEGAVVVAAGAYWKGNITADYVRIEGKIKGDIVARSKVELTRTSVVNSDLSAPLIAIEEGSTYQGTINQPRKTQVKHYSERRGTGDPNRPA